MLILFYDPNTNIPLFEKAKKAFKQNVMMPSDIVSEMQDVGFVVQQSEYSLPIDIEKNKYYNNLRKRFMSVLSLFTEDEIETGILQLEQKYYKTDRIVTEVSMVSILGCK